MQLRTFIHKANAPRKAFEFDPEDPNIKDLIFRKGEYMYIDTSHTFYGVSPELKLIRKGDFLVPWKADRKQCYELITKESMAENFIEVEVLNQLT